MLHARHERVLKADLHEQWLAVLGIPVLASAALSRTVREWPRALAASPAGQHRMASSLAICLVPS